MLFWLPVGSPRFDSAILEALHLTKWYAREHVLLCLLPAFFIAGSISTFIRQGVVMKYLGPDSPKAVAYGVAAISGSILAVCSCTVLPLFTGIYRLGAGLGPASAFLYSGPAINVLAIIMTMRILGVEIGVARMVCWCLRIGLQPDRFRRVGCYCERQMDSIGNMPCRNFVDDMELDLPSKSCPCCSVECWWRAFYLGVCATKG